MDDLEKMVEEQAVALMDAKDSVFDLIDKQVKTTDNVKKAVDLIATKTALSDQDNIDKIIDEKSEELRFDAETKRIEAETAKINEEVQKVKAQAEKELVELNKEIERKRLEIEQMKAESDRETAYFERNKEILKYVNVKTKKTLKVMQRLMIPAIVIFIIVQALVFPLTLGGLILSNIVEIVGSICGSIKNNALKIALSVVVIAIVVGLLVCSYYFGIKFIKRP